MIPFRLTEKWSEKYKRSIDCKNPKGFSQRAHCQGRSTNEANEIDRREVERALDDTRATGEGINAKMMRLLKKGKIPSHKWANMYRLLLQRAGKASEKESGKPVIKTTPELTYEPENRTEAFTGLLEATRKKKLTGAAFERSVVNTGKKSKTGSGAQTPDIKIKHSRSKNHIEAEAKAGNHIDFFQSTVTGKVKTEKGKIHKIGIDRPEGKTAKRLGRLTGRATGYVAKHTRRKMTGKTYSKSATHRGKPISTVAKAFSGNKKEVKKKITNKSLHAMLHAGGDPVHIHHNTTTGEIAVVPVSNKHKRHTNAMGLRGQPSIEQIAHHPNERRSSLGGKMRLRRKETRANASLEGDSHKMIDAVKRHGGTVFKNHDEFHAHMSKHKVKISTGHAR